MATVNHYTYSLEKGEDKIRYALEKQMPDDPVRGEFCSSNAETAVQEFKDALHVHSPHSEKPIAEMIQSFSARESKFLNPDFVNQLGYELVTKVFPGHQALVVTHIDREHYHNHIIMNRHHFDTGKLARDSLTVVKQLRDTNDDICLKHGLSVLNKDRQDREARMPKKVADMIKHSRFSYIADMMQKADLARALATNYGQYQTILSEFGINVRIEKENISYSYPGRKVPKRGKNMGRFYDKDGLEEAFKRNYERIQSNPSLKSILSVGVNKAGEGNVSMMKLSDEMIEKTNGHFKSGVKDYSKAPIVPRREARWARASEDELRQLQVPIDEIRRAKKVNIINYCHANKIKLESLRDNVYTLKDRPYVELSPFEWRNTKNNTRGNIVDFVAVHKKKTFLEAVAYLNGNDRLRLLQKEVGAVKRTATSFYIPSSERDHSHEASAYLRDLLRHRGMKDTITSSLIKSNQVQISKNGLIRFFCKDDEHSALEFSKDAKGQWQRQTKGDITKPFLSLEGSGKKLVVFPDLFSFIQSHGSRSFRNLGGDTHTLILIEPDHKIIDQFLSGKKGVDRIQIVTNQKDTPSKIEVDFFNNLRTRYQSFGIHVDLGPSHDLSRGRGLSLEF